MEVDHHNNLGVWVRSHPLEEFLVVMFSDQSYLECRLLWCHFDNLTVIKFSVTGLADTTQPMIVNRFLGSERVFILHVGPSLLPLPFGARSFYFLSAVAPHCLSHKFFFKLKK
jgi:hypothetical protein